MKSRLKTIGSAVIISIPIFLIAAIYSLSSMNAGRALTWDEFSEGLIGRTSNCGGNSAAASNCRMIALDVRVEASDSDDVFNLEHISQNSRNDLAHLSSNMWTSGAKYLLRSGPIHIGEGTHELIVVCDTPYDNVPQPTIWNLHHRTLRHAAGYSDGSIGWLTPAEFAGLNKSNFCEIKYAIPTPEAASSANSFE
jgi:hypothetical protein